MCRLYVGQALSPANSLCSTAESFPLGIPISQRRPSCLSLGVWLAPSREPGRLQAPTGVNLSAGRAFLVLDREVDQAAFGPVWLQDARVGRVVAEALLYGQSGRHFYQLRAWVIMPNHVPVLLLPKMSLPVIMRWLKGSTARAANLILGRTGEAFWQDESFDHRVRDEAELDRLVQLCGVQPGKRRPGGQSHAWPWSSAGLAGESACPTIGPNRSRNVETPATGQEACPTAFTS